MNRYESAYRDYTMQRGSSAMLEPDEANAFPQKPERSKRNLGPVAGRVMRQKETMSDTSAESYDAARVYSTGHQNRGFGTDDEYYRHHQISSRELSDRSGGERSNPDFVVANDAIRAYPRRVICTVSS